ncbi:MAG TPA: hypothetical protein VF188_03370 [Longimicrobiales bacterium]
MTRIEAIQGRYDSRESVAAALASAFGPDWRVTVNGTLAGHGPIFMRPDYGRIVGYRAEGYLGQYLIIYPEKCLVAVRMVESSPAYAPATDGFAAFQELVRDLVP